MPLAKVLIASPVNQSPAILRKFALSLLNLDVTAMEASFLFIDDNSDSESREVLSQLSKMLPCRIILSQEPSEAYRTEMKHSWNVQLIRKVSHFRDQILQYAGEKGYDYLLLIDSDLLLHPLTLSHLVNRKKDILSEIYWTAWVPGGPLFPQVWLYDNYTQYDSTEYDKASSSFIKQKIKDFHQSLLVPGVYKVGGLGGCTLLSEKVLKSNVSFKRVPNLSFTGEDRHFCVRAAVAGFDLYVDTCYPACHVYRLSDLPEAEVFMERCGYQPIESLFYFSENKGEGREIKKT